MGGTLSLRPFSDLDLELDFRAVIAGRQEAGAVEGEERIPAIKRKGKYNEKFPDLSELPPELGLAVLSHLDATDLCLASCVWYGLAEDESLWRGLCKSQWGYISAYRRPLVAGMSYRRLYLLLDEGTLTFNAEAAMGMDYFFRHDLLDDNPDEIARFFHCTSKLNLEHTRCFLDERRDVLEKLVSLQNFSNQFLPNALRKFFARLQAPNSRGNYLQALLDKFSRRFCDCNPQLGLTHDTVYILCYSLIMLSVDLCSPHVKNKMSKREFIRNVRRALRLRIDDELCGHLYDDIYLRGHIAPNSEL